MTAHIKTPTKITITWDNSASSRYDNIPRSVLTALNTGKDWSQHATK